MQRVPQLDGLRGIAVLLVFAYHAWRVPLCWSGVDLFFVLSGYLITGILLRLKEKRDAGGYARNFYVRRVRRIIPPYAGFILFLILFVPVPWRHVWYWYAFFAGNFATTFGHVDLHALVPLWSLGVEEQFYLIWPWIVLACSRRSLRRVALGIVIAAPILRAICTPLVHDHGFISALTPFRADLLAAGAWVAIMSTEDPAWIELHRRSSLYIFVGSIVGLMAFSTRHSFRQTANSLSFNTLGYSLIVALFSSALVHVLSLGTGPAYRVLTSRPLRFMGMISYTFYLYQVPFLDMIARRAPLRTASVALGFVATAIFATLSWYLLESPILHWGGGHAPAVVQRSVAADQSTS
jgi:peptidoglycan/LPS O-acetylase OafA/YrhL